MHAVTRYSLLDRLDDAEAQLEATQATLDTLAENAASAYAVLARIIEMQIPKDAARYQGSTPAQMVDGLVAEYGEDGLLEELGVISGWRVEVIKQVSGTELTATRR